MNYTQENINTAVGRLYSTKQAQEVHSLLEEYGKQRYEREVYRVRLAIVKLSQGDKDKLREYIQLAKLDYRDVLFAAEYITKGKGSILIENPYIDLI